jgi:hypothetical protein
MNRKLFWLVAAIGLALVVAPLAISLPSRAAGGERMMNGFEPIMQPDQVRMTARYYDDVFVPLGNVAPLMSAENVAKFQGYAASFKALKGPQAAAMRRDFGLLLAAMQANTGIFAQVPAGLAHYEPLVRTMQANVDNFHKVNGLPDFRLFTWFFIGPGVLLLAVAAFGLFGARLGARHAPRAHPAV